MSSSVRWLPLHKLRDLSLDLTLANGQAFNWMRQSKSLYTGVVGRFVVSLRTATEKERSTGGAAFAFALHYPPVVSQQQESQATQMLLDYFQVHADYSSLYREWAAADGHFEQKVAQSFRGVRVLDQDPVECLFSFICSSNNNIKRIHQMVVSLRQRYGDFLCVSPVDGVTPLHAFPSVDQLCSASEEELRALGFGYRASFVTRTASALQARNGAAFLSDLKKNKTREEAVEELQQFHGVGRKVADCVALFSLAKEDCVPVDTHVRQIAERDYHFKSKAKSKTVGKVMYGEIGDLFRGVFGPYAGWAHSVRVFVCMYVYVCVQAHMSVMQCTHVRLCASICRCCLRRTFQSTSRVKRKILVRKRERERKSLGRRSTVTPQPSMPRRLRRRRRRRRARVWSKSYCSIKMFRFIYYIQITGLSAWGPWAWAPG
jgi:N-glycosylase/DNA lyase